MFDQAIRVLKEESRRYEKLKEETKKVLYENENPCVEEYWQILVEMANIIVNLPSKVDHLLSDIQKEEGDLFFDMISNIRKELSFLSEFAAEAIEDKNEFKILAMLRRKGSRFGEKNRLEELAETLEKQTG
ncbi:MAG: hypothetical protein ACOC35_17110 [Promethearchaeia archaeon]